ncbi:hypothetical protein [Streptomyces brasiliensis]|uniref:Uncharacterized protein n=1 Tax=Streptomyces brasiliensis TaxID=1954 RepID=A0A917P5Z8_9ACTN|nr:hypothetical protein [Streptomyces brasiliensis]GGJ63295.1 hypothetical protein GCM10010121_087450 [Streptomyces brasiliensis]
MAELVFGVIGAVVGLGGLALTFVGNRQQRRQARELGARETHLQAREREAERREASVHASMLRVEVTRHASTLDPSVSLWRLTVTNGSTQPFTGVALRYDDRALGSPTLNGHLNPGASTADALPVAGEPDPARCVVEFTDVAGRLWRRRATGDLRLGRRGPDGQVTWDADEPYAIHARDISGHVGMYKYRVPRAHYRSSSGCTPALVLLTLSSVAYLIMYFVHR